MTHNSSREATRRRGKLTGRSTARVNGFTKSRRERPRADDMLECALGLFADVGFAKATAKAIAKAAGVNPALLYYYYANKEDLFTAALRYAINMAIEGHDNIGIVERIADPAAVIRYWFETNKRLSSPLSQMLRLMVEYRTASTRIPEVEKLIRKFYEAEVSLLSRAIRRGIAIGQFRRVDVNATALFVSMHLDGLSISVSVLPRASVTKAIDQLELILFDHLLARETRAARSPVRARKTIAQTSM